MPWIKKSELDALREACAAAESILRYVEPISTNCNGTRPNMTTQKALRLVRAALGETK